MKRLLGGCALLLLLAVQDVGAQGVGNRGGGGGIRRRLDQPGRGQLPPDAPVVRRQQLEQQIRRGFWRVTKERLGFNDEQMNRLELTSNRFDVRRKQLGQDERVARIALRTEVLLDTAANQATIAAAIDRLHAVQLERMELHGDEQKELAAFMTPLQRAKFMALQEQIRRRIQEMQKGRPEGGGPPGAFPVR